MILVEAFKGKSVTEQSVEIVERKGIRRQVWRKRWRTSMARITIEDCLEKVSNRFALIHVAARRVRELRKGAEPLIITKNRDVVTALREIAAGKVSYTYEPEGGGDEAAGSRVQLVEEKAREDAD